MWVQFVAGGEPANLTASADIELQSQSDIGGLAISPDGANIAFDARPKGDAPPLTSVWVIPAPLGGIPRKFLEHGRAVQWSPDGTKILYVAAVGSGGDALLVADADGGNPREVAPRRGGMHKHWPAWSRDGRYIYFNYSITTTNSEPTEIYRVAATGGPIEPVVTTARRAVFPAPTSDGAGLIYSANPDSADLSLWWRPVGRHCPTTASDDRNRRVRGSEDCGRWSKPGVDGDRLSSDAHHPSGRCGLRRRSSEDTHERVLRRPGSGTRQPGRSPGLQFHAVGQPQIVDRTSGRHSSSTSDVG